MEHVSDQLEWLVVALVYNNACYDIEDQPENPGYVKMEKQKNSFFNAIKDSQFSDKIKTFIVEARIGLSKEDNQVHQRICICEKEGNRIKDWLVERTDEITLLSDAKGIAGILGHLVGLYKAKRHIVVTFGHGSVFGINYLPLGQITSGGEKDTANKEAAGEPDVFNDFSDAFTANGVGGQQEGVPGVPAAPVLTFIETVVKGLLAEQLLFRLGMKGSTGLKEIGRAQETFNLLTNFELHAALQEVFGGDKLDILVMYNCLMQNLFTQYELRASVEYLVAPLTGICHPGYDYRNVFKELTQHPAMDTEDVARLFLDTARADRKPSHQLYFGDIEGTWKLYAVKLDQALLEEVQSGFRELMRTMAGLLGDPYLLYSLRLAQRQLYNYAQHSLPEVKIIDLPILLAYWGEKIKAFPGLAPLEMPIDGLRSSLAKMRSFAFTGERLYDTSFYYVDQDLARHTATGFGLWFPHKAPRKGNLVFAEILKPNSLQDIIPSFVRDTGYAQVFGRYIARFG